MSPLHDTFRAIEYLDTVLNDRIESIELEKKDLPGE